MSNSNTIGNSHLQVPANHAQTNAAQPDVGVALINNRGVAQTISWREHVEGAHDFLFFARSCYNLAQFSHALEGAPTPLESRVVQAGTDDHRLPTPTGQGTLNNDLSTGRLLPPTGGRHNLGNAGENRTVNGGLPLSFLLNEENDRADAFEWPSFAVPASPEMNANRNAAPSHLENTSASIQARATTTVASGNLPQIAPASNAGPSTAYPQPKGYTNSDATPANSLWSSYPARHQQGASFTNQFHNSYGANGPLTSSNLHQDIITPDNAAPAPTQTTDSQRHPAKNVGPVGYYSHLSPSLRKMSTYQANQLDRLQRKQNDYPHIDISAEAKEVVDGALKLLADGTLFDKIDKKDRRGPALEDNEKIAAYHIYRNYTYSLEDLGNVFRCSASTIQTAISLIRYNYSKSRRSG
ncbi:MAG: hypothetical protein ACR652_06195 [Methylocystis sp.]|uniref:hypothetical protein n=1 Tax=Methylocystis sp. TaxID=1911079 RepID=UPI003DA2F8D9